MKIVYFIDHLRPDGTQHVLGQLVGGLAARGHEQAVVCLNDSWDQALVADLKRSGAEVRIPGKVMLLSGYGLLSTLRWLQRKRFDAAVTFLFFSDVVGRTLAHAAAVPRIVSSLRARNVNYSFLQRWLARKTMRWADAVIINSQSVRDFAIAEEGALPSRLHCIPNGLRVQDFAHPMERSELRAELGLAPDRVLIASVGRLTRQKGLDLLLEALALIPRQDIDLLLVGEGEQEPELRRQVRTLGLDNRVHFTGYRRDVPQLLGALDLYVHPARFEGMPNILLEAMAAGCPIVASAVDGSCELIESESIGWLVPPQNSARLAEAIRQALDSPSEAQCRTGAALERVHTQYSLDAMIGAWERIVAEKNRDR